MLDIFLLEIEKIFERHVSVTNDGGLCHFRKARKKNQPELLSLIISVNFSNENKIYHVST